MICQTGSSREIIVKATRIAGLYDRNISVYITRLKKYMLVENGTYKLNPQGRVEAKKFAHDLDDPNLAGIDWNNKTKSSRKTSRTSQEELRKVAEWVNDDIEVGAIDIRTLSPMQQAMFALWLLTVQQQIVKAVKPKLAYLYLKQQFTTVEGNQKGFTDSFSRPGNKKRFGKNDAGEYYLKPDGIKEIEAMKSGKTQPVTER